MTNEEKRKAEERGIIVFALAVVFATARIVKVGYELDDHDGATAAFDQAEQFVAEAERRGISIKRG